MLGPCSAIDPFLACLNCSTEDDFGWPRSISWTTPMLGPCSAIDPFLACLSRSTEDDFVDAVIHGCVATVASNAAVPCCSYVIPLSASVASASGCLVTAACCSSCASIASCKPPLLRRLQAAVMILLPCSPCLSLKPLLPSFTLLP